MNDLISRQGVIDALSQYPFEKVVNCLSMIEEFPSAEKPFKLPEIHVAEGFDTVEDEDGNIGFGVYVPDENKIYVAGDVEGEIRARALFHEVCHWVQAMCGRPFDEDEANEFSDIVYDALPSAQPELSLEQVLEYCRSRCITVVEDEVLYKRLDSAYTEGYTAAESKYRALWDEMPKIVYCRECMHREYCFSDVAMTNRSQTSTIYESIEYCSYGERRTDETD